MRSFELSLLKKRTPRQEAMANARYQGRHTQTEWEELLVRFGYRCTGCGVAHAQSPLTKDHVVPVSKGGSNSISNIQPLCRPCNSKKGVRA